MTDDQPAEAEFAIELPAEIAGGTYADFANLWHTSDVFTLDFAAIVQPATATVDQDTGKQVVRVQTRVVSRVRIPPGQVFELMKALEQQLSAWELETGRRPPESAT
jgi:hypothetical protein